MIRCSDLTEDKYDRYRKIFFRKQRILIKIEEKFRSLFFFRNFRSYLVFAILVNKRVKFGNSSLFNIKFQRVCYDTNITMVSYSAFQTYDKYLVLDFQTYVKYLVVEVKRHVQLVKRISIFLQSFAKSTKCSWRSKYYSNQSSRQFQRCLFNRSIVLSLLFVCNVKCKQAFFLSFSISNTELNACLRRY
jgi:hypothetical protein